MTVRLMQRFSYAVRPALPEARMVEKGIARLGRPLADVTAAIENVGKLEIHKLEKRFPTLATIAGAAPLMGFLRHRDRDGTGLL